MNNKVLVKIIVPEIDSSYDVFIPVNEIVWKIKKMLIRSIYDLSGGELEVERDYNLISKATSKIYDNNDIIVETDIRNASELILISIKSANVIEMSIPMQDSNMI